MRIQTHYDEALERAYYDDEDKGPERDPDDWRDEMRERHHMEREDEGRRP